MTIRYVWSGATGAANGTSWTDAYTTLGAGIAAATVAGDMVYIASDHSEQLAADTLYSIPSAHTIAAPLKILSMNRADTTPLAGAFVGHSSSSFSIGFSAAIQRAIYVFGLTLQVSGSLADYIYLGIVQGTTTWESCKIYMLSSSGSTGIYIGTVSDTRNMLVVTKNCEFKWGSTSQGFVVNAKWESIGDSFSAGATHPAKFIKASSGSGGIAKIHNGDLSAFDSILGNQAASTSMVVVELYGSKIKAGAVLMDGPGNPSGGSVIAYDCAAGDQHFHMAHSDYYGSMTVETGIHANDGAQYDGANRCSWKIVTTANCSYYTPYVSPWFGRYRSATSAITPHIEILRDGSTTAYQDDEVWGEWSAKTTTGSTLATLYDDRMTLLGTPANQAAGVGVSGWTGEGASAWSGKLAPPSSFTPAEIGHLMARVCVGEPSITVYVDPAIRGA